jgi:hypothetical protein
MSRCWSVKLEFDAYIDRLFRRFRKMHYAAINRDIHIGIPFDESRPISTYECTLSRSVPELFTGDCPDRGKETPPDMVVEGSDVYH